MGTIHNLHRRIRQVVWLLAFFAVSGVSMAQSIVYLTSNSSTNNYLLKGSSSNYYFVTSNVTIKASGDHNAMKVNEGSTAVIYIAKGCTLTVAGGNSSGRVGAGSAIWVPSNASLIVTGEGTLDVKGGNGYNGGNGGNGGNGWLSTSGKGKGHGGSGGSGGYGGGGAAAAIGGYGGNGHESQAGPVQDDKACDYGSYDRWGIAGYETKAGSNGTSMGNVYLIGNVTVKATGGSAGASGGSSGNFGGKDNDSGSGWFWDYCSGAGGPGGGGGSGYGAIYGIGGGAPGAQCGATGSTGGTFSGRGWKYRSGRGGAGGLGARPGAVNVSTPDNEAAKGGGISNTEGQHGSHGNLYYKGKNTQAGGRNCTSLSDYPAQIKLTITLDDRGGTGGSGSFATCLGTDMQKTVAVPQRRGYYFCGYYTEPQGGSQVYTATGQVKNQTCEYFKNKTLYAQWTEAVAVNVTKNIAYTTSIQDALDKASVGDQIRLNMSMASGSLYIKKAMTLDLNGHSLDKVYIQISEAEGKKGSVILNNGKIDHLDGSETLNTLFHGTAELNHIECREIYCDGNNFNINSGTYGNIYNTITNKDLMPKLGIVTIKGEKTFVAGLNVNYANPYYIMMLGGCFGKAQAERFANGKAAERNVRFPANYEIKTVKTADEEAPAADYTNYVVMKTNFVNYTHIKNESVNTNLVANDGTTVKLHFIINHLSKGLNHIFGSTGKDDTSKDGFGLYVDGSTRQFVFAAGGSFERSDVGLAKDSMDFYVTLNRGSLRIDRTENASNDYYHKNIAIYTTQYSNHPITLGKVNDGTDAAAPCDITVYDFSVSQAGELKCHYVPAYGFENFAQVINFCFYDEVNDKVVYNQSDKPLTESVVGFCAKHPLYRISGTGGGAKRSCVICGTTSEVEPMLESENTIFTPATESGALYKLHKAELSGNCTETCDTLGTKTVPTIKRIKFLSLTVEKDGKQIHRYEPSTSCGKFYIYDGVTDSYMDPADVNVTANYNASEDHVWVLKSEDANYWNYECKACKTTNKECKHAKYNSGYTIRDGVKYRVCATCSKEAPYEENYLHLDPTQYIDLGFQPTSTTTVRMTFAQNELGSGAYFGSRNYGLSADNANLKSNKQNYRSAVAAKTINSIRYDGAKVYTYDVPEAEYGKYTKTINPETLSNPTSDGTETTFRIGQRQGVAEKNPGFDFYRMEIYDGAELKHELVPAKRNGKFGVLDIVEQKFHALSEQLDNQPAFAHCSHHLYCDITKNSDEYEVVSWTMHCRICDSRFVLTGEEPFMITNHGVSYWLPIDAQNHKSLEMEFESIDGTDYQLSDISFISDQNLVIGYGGKDKPYRNIRFADFHTLNKQDAISHHYFPSIWEGKPQLYDAVSDKHYQCKERNGAQVYAPKCRVHHYCVIEKSGSGADLKLTRHCNICDERMVQSGLVVESADVLRRLVFKEDSLYQMHMGILHANGELDNATYAMYPEITSKDMVLNLDIMQEGKLIHNYLPALRKGEKEEEIRYGMYDAITEQFVSVEGATVSINGCDHPYYTLNYADGKVTKRCHLCDEMTETVGYYVDITYKRTADEKDGPQMSQRIMRLNDLSDDTDHTLLPNKFKRGAYFFGGWKTPQGQKELQPGEELLPNDKLKGNIVITAKWNDGFIANGDTLEINDENTKTIHLVDNGKDIFSATRDFLSQEMTYSRDLSESQGQTWGTLCLPFSVESNENVQFYLPTEVTTNAKGQMNIILTAVETVEGGAPCIFEMKNTEDGMLRITAAQSSNIDVVAEAGTTQHGELKLAGSYIYDTFLCDDSDVTFFAIAGDKFRRTERQMTVRPYHAHLETPTGSDASVREMIYFTTDDETTGLEKVEEMGDDAHEYYRLNGIRTSHPNVKGIYVRKGKKMVK